MRPDRFVPVLLMAALIFGAVAPASAHIAAFNINVYAPNHESNEGGANGAIQCTTGEDWRVSLRLNQKGSGYRGVGSTSGVCSGGSDPWSVSTTSNSGDLVCTGGLVRFIIVGKTFASGIADDKTTFTATAQPCGP